MADLSKLNKNNEQRVQLASNGTLQVSMPGGQTLEEGVQHVIGAIPYGALLKGWTAAVSGGWAVTVSIGTVDFPTLFTTALGVSSSNVNDKAQPMEYFFPEGAELVANITSVGQAPADGVFEFTLDYTEVNTTCGAYTA